ncbi:MAG TPA: malonyl-CoA decarboxylase N-terminal domain-containing protein, partial [Accumulibacter sp.]|nr:malonyl-CoA decarboxylase N-terminal domain-containing protein [Accumulibacter sp.]
MAENIVSRSLKKVRRLLAEGAARHRLDSRELVKVRNLLHECASGAGGEVSTRRRAARLAETYQDLDDDGRAAFLRLIATEFGPDPARVEQAHAAYQAAIGDAAQWKAESSLRQALRSSRLRILSQFTALPQGVKFLVDLRADLLRFLTRDPALPSLDR